MKLVQLTLASILIGMSSILNRLARVLLDFSNQLCPTHPLLDPDLERSEFLRSERALWDEREKE